MTARQSDRLARLEAAAAPVGNAGTIGLRVIVHPGEDQDAIVQAALDAKARELGRPLEPGEAFVVVRVIISPPERPGATIIPFQGGA